MLVDISSQTLLILFYFYISSPILHYHYHYAFFFYIYLFCFVLFSVIWLLNANFQFTLKIAINEKHYGQSGQRSVRCDEAAWNCKVREHSAIKITCMFCFVLFLFCFLFFVLVLFCFNLTIRCRQNGSF